MTTEAQPTPILVKCSACLAQLDHWPQHCPRCRSGRLIVVSHPALTRTTVEAAQ
jgi:Zn finger protein HypA/HybF involved in hydrogenase expression